MSETAKIPSASLWQRLVRMVFGDHGLVWPSHWQITK